MRQGGFFQKPPESYPRLPRVKKRLPEGKRFFV